MRRTPSGAAVLALTALAAAAAGAASPVPASGQEAEADREDPAAITPASVDSAVAEVFRGARRLSLDEAVEIALRRSPELEQARAELQRAEQDRLGAYGTFLPDVSLGYGYTNSSTGRLDPTNQAITRTSYSLQLGGSLDLFTGLRRVHDLDAAKRRVDAREEGYREQRYATVESVTRAYLDAVAAAELVRVEEARLRRQRDQLRFVRNQVEVGRATRSDVLRSEVELNNARLALLQAENDARDATFRLSAAVGVEARVAPAPGASLEAPTLERDRDELVRAALEAAPALERARAQTRAARSEVESARSSYLPNLTLSGGWAWQNSEYPPANRSWSVSLSGRYPLFNGFRRETQLFRAETQVRLAEARERATELGIRADVDAAYSTVEAARAGIRLAERSVELTREDLQVTRERFRLGLATILDLQTAQINLQEAEADLVRRRYDLRAGIARLESLLGTDLTGGAIAP